MSGLTPDGFVVKRTPELKLDLEELLQSAFGPVNLNDSSVLGQLVGLTVEQQTIFWELLQQVYWSQYPSSAEGVNLDRVVSLNGVTRLAAAPTSVLAVVSGAAGTLLSAGRLASNSQTSDQYQLVDSVTIAAANSVGARVVVSALLDNTNYTITLNGVSYTYNSGAAATQLSILTNLAGLMPVYITATVTGSGSNAVMDLKYDTPQPIVVGARLAISSLSVYGTFAATRPGPTVLLPGGLDTIVTPISGWESVTNRSPGTTGRNAETDSELRSRRAKSLKLGGQNTIESITATLGQLPGVLTQRVAVNNGDTTNAEGIPGHSIRAIVDGGVAEDIARVLFDYVAAGIGYYGSITIDVPSEVTGTTFPVKFDRPTNVQFYVTVTFNDSANTPVNAVQAIRDALTAYAAELTIAEPVLYTRLFTPINAVIGDGAYVTELKIGLAPSPTGTTNLTPDPDERFVLPPENIQVFTV